MRFRGRALVAALATAALAIGDITPAEALAQRRERPERTEMSRAVRNCHRALVVGGALGAVVGAIAAGRRDRAEGALIGGAGGLAVGGILCLTMIQHARNEARIIAAQRMAAAASPGSQQTSAIPQEKGGSVPLLSRAVDVQLTAAPRSVRYPTLGGGEAVSTQQICRRDDNSGQLYCRTDAGDWARNSSTSNVRPASSENWQPLLCRRVTTQIMESEGRVDLPGQLWCRTGANEWQPYAERSRSNATG